MVLLCEGEEPRRKLCRRRVQTNMLLILHVLNKCNFKKKKTRFKLSNRLNKTFLKEGGGVMKYAIAFVSIFLVCASNASAASVRGEKSGSSYLIWVTNNSSNSVQCSGIIYARYMQHGSSGNSSTNVSGNVGPNSNNFLLSRWNTGWAASTLEFDHNVQCS